MPTAPVAGTVVGASGSSGQTSWSKRVRPRSGPYAAVNCCSTLRLATSAVESLYRFAMVPIHTIATSYPVHVEGAKP